MNLVWVWSHSIDDTRATNVLMDSKNLLATKIDGVWDFSTLELDRAQDETNSHSAKSLKISPAMPTIIMAAIMAIVTPAMVARPIMIMITAITATSIKITVAPTENASCER
jgi:hypothetical protein